MDDAILAPPNIPESLGVYLKLVGKTLLHTFPTKIYGIYIYGSLSYGDFDEVTSDVDVIVVIKEPFTKVDIKSLEGIVEQYRLSHKDWLKRTELDFVEIGEINQKVNNTIETVRISDSTVKSGVKMHGASIDLANLSECGIVLFGPHPATFMPRVSRELLTQALREKFLDLKRNIPTWMTLNLWNQAFIVVQLCRVIYTLKTNKYGSKKTATKWCTENLPEPFNEVALEADNKIKNFNGPLSKTLETNIPRLVAYIDKMFETPEVNTTADN